MKQFPGLEDLGLIDANANRAREGIRTAEDYIRFIAGDCRWAEALKKIRGSITRLLNEHFSDADLLRSRNVRGDPLRPTENNIAVAASTAERPATTAQRGLKRAEEAVRVLEEYLRAPFPATSARFAAFRYQLYEAEQWLVVAGKAAGVVAEAKVYVLLTEAFCSQGLMATAKSVLKGGAKLVQFREKEKPDRKYLQEARELLKLCEDFGAVLICNDRADCALAANAAGVHLGQDDLAPGDIRRLAGERLLAGRSTHSVEEAQRAFEQEEADYIAIGSMYKPGAKENAIISGLCLAEKINALQLSVPVFAIGGITLERVAELKTVGVNRIAVSTAIISDRDPESACRGFVEAMAK